MTLEIKKEEGNPLTNEIIDLSGKIKRYLHNEILKLKEKGQLPKIDVGTGTATLKPCYRDGYYVPDKTSYSGIVLDEGFYVTNTRRHVDDGFLKITNQRPMIVLSEDGVVEIPFDPCDTEVTTNLSAKKEVDPGGYITHFRVALNKISEVQRRSKKK